MGAINFAYHIEESLFIEDFEELSWKELLTYYQNRTHVQHFPLSRGTAKNQLKADRLLKNEFSFNNETHTLPNAFNWRVNPSKDLEWFILLHKFYYLKDLARAYDYTHDESYAEKWVSLIRSWIRQIPDGFIDSQVTGRRLQQWLISYPVFVNQYHSLAITADFFERFLYSIHSQTHYLCHNLTPDGNHRTIELYAIFMVAVTFPELKSSAWFLEFSTQQLLANMQQDLLPDGVHRELSTDYHHSVLENYLRFRGLAVLNNIKLPEACEVLLKQAIKFSYYAHKPDGFIPAISDGDCNSHLSLLKKAQRYYVDPYLDFIISQGKEGLAPEQRSCGFSHSGYYILRSDWNAHPYEEALYLFFDCAGLGFGSHGHYDALNFEMAAYGQSLIVDPGRYTYNEKSNDGINWRRYFKGTDAHNTVVVDGMDQMPYQSGRPTNPEPKTTLQHFISTENFDLVQGQIISQRYSAIHQRLIFFVQAEYWIIIDVLSSRTPHNYELYFHLSDKAQNKTLLFSTEDYHSVLSPHLLLIQPNYPDSTIAIEQSYVSPEYGLKYKAPVVKSAKMQECSTNFHTVLYPFKDSASHVQIKQLPVYYQGQQCQDTQATALRISIQTAEGSHYEDYFFVNHQEDNKEYMVDDIRCTDSVLFLRRDDLGQTIKDFKFTSVKHP